eukprot:scaffold1813_cov185-Alexandrium_tamarense.AAC.6
MSLRRRGKWSGYIIVLTDSPPDRYNDVWDDRVIVMHPFPKHYQSDDGTQMQYTSENTSLIYKRFKTYMLDYVDSEPRLDSVQLVYYLDIDIMVGNTVKSLISDVESKYNVLQSNGDLSERRSRLYFFTPFSTQWPLQGGTFIVERKTSRHCLELWRREIEEMTRTGRGRDQDALRKIYQRIQSGEETKCELVRMENENHLSLPMAKTICQSEYTKRPIRSNRIRIYQLGPPSPNIQTRSPKCT